MASKTLRATALSMLIASFLFLTACGKAPEQQNAAPPPMPVTVVTLKAESVALTRELAGRANAS